MMKVYKRMFVSGVIFFIYSFCFAAYATASMQAVKSSQESTVAKEFEWNERGNKPSKEQQVGVGVAVYREAVKVNYRRNKKQILHIEFKEPVMVYQADKPQRWGFVQFPRIIGSQRENKIAALWNLAEDDITARPKIGWKYSGDNGKTWFFRWNERPSDLGIRLADGDKLKLVSRSFRVEEHSSLSSLLKKNFITNARFNFYEKSELPDSLTGFYMNRFISSRNRVIKECANIKNDEDILRYSAKGVFPVQAWGNLRKMPDGSLMTCQYPVFLKNKDRIPELSAVGFYRSTDNGHSWTMISRIPFQPDDVYEPKNVKRDVYGFTEPAFDVLANGKMICILRSSIKEFVGPMYISVSEDFGKTWTVPRVMANNGVSPQLLTLDNGVTVLASGRPGVQVRFLDNPDAAIWTDPFEMLRFKGLAGQVSCGYTGLWATGADRFLIIYSDFRSRGHENIPRKAIIVREVIVKKK